MKDVVLEIDGVKIEFVAEFRSGVSSIGNYFCEKSRKKECALL